MEAWRCYGLKGGPGHRHRAGHCLSEGRGVRVYRVAAAEALRWGRTERFGCYNSALSRARAESLLCRPGTRAAARWGLCDTGVRGF